MVCSLLKLLLLYDEIIIHAGVLSTVSGNVYTITIPIREDGITNNTKVRCVAVLQGNGGEINSQNGTIIIQGIELQ